MLEIEAPAGTHAIDMGAGLFVIDEDELLLGEQNFRVTSVRREILDGIPLTRLVVVPE